MKITSNLRDGIFKQGPENVIFSGSCSTSPYGFFGPGEEIRKNPRDGGFPKRPKL